MQHQDRPTSPDHDQNEDKLQQRPRDPNWLGVGSEDEETRATEAAEKPQDKPRQVGIPTD